MKKIFLLITIVLPFVCISCGDDKDEPVIPDNHAYVDLGLPSRTLWATCNVGAENPEEYGDYFAWGETAPKDKYDWSNYKWCNETEYALTKYNNTSYYGKVDNKTELDREDDAAYVNWGALWRMPSLEQIQELCKYCTWQWTQVKGVYGHLVTGPSGKTMFLPAAGGCGTNSQYNVGKFAYYWSRTLCSDKLAIEAAGPGEAYILFMNSWESEVWYDSRCIGNTVRAVRAFKN